jgi:hypothetical protein
MNRACGGVDRKSPVDSRDSHFASVTLTLGVPHLPARLSVTKPMIRKLKSGKYRLYSRKVDPNTKKRRNLGTFASRAAAEQHEREVQYFKRQ